MALNAQPLWAFFHLGKEQNRTYYHTYCKGCVAQHEVIGDERLDDVSECIAQKMRFEAGEQLWPT